MDEPPETEPPAEDSRTGRRLGTALCLITLILYWPVSGYEFIHFDDPIFVIQNEHVNQGFTADGIIWAFTRGEIDYWRPLTWLSHMADVHFFGLKPGPHHVTSVIIHALNALLLFVFFSIALRNRPAAFFIAALFAWHPLHVESVAWIAERKDVLSGLFWHGCFVLYARYARSGARKYYWWALAVFGLGLMAKPMIVTLPCQLLLLDIWPFRRGQNGIAGVRRLIGEKAPFLALAIVASVFAYYAQRSVGEMAAGSVPALSTRLGNAVLAYGSYLRHTVLPVDLGVFYPFPESLPAAALGFSLLALAGLTCLAISRRGRNPEMLCGWLFFLGTIVPVVGLLKVGGQASADRYTYIATTGLFWIAAMFLFPRGDRREIRGAPGIIAGITLLLLLGLSRTQIRHWQDSITLFSHTVSVTENNLVMMNNLARAHLAKGELDQAQSIYEDLVSRRAQHFAHHHLGAIHLHRGDPAAAEFHFRAALAVEPGYSPPAFELGRLMFSRRKYREAANLFERVLHAEPGNAAAEDYLRRITELTSTAR